MTSGTDSAPYALKSSDTKSKLNALYRIGNSRMARYAEEVLELMKRDKNPVVKGRCAWVLGRLCCQAAYPQLVEHLRHSAPEVRTWSAWALGELGQQRAELPLKAALNREAKDQIRSAIGGALKKLNFVSTRIHRNQVLQALRPPLTNDEQILEAIQQLERRSFPEDKDEIIALRSSIKDKNPAYFEEYMKWVKRKPGLIALLDDDTKVFH